MNANIIQRISYRKKAFTLLEVLFAIAIAGVVMASCVALLFNMVKIMENFEENDSFAAHVDSVENFLKMSFVKSAFPSNADQSLIGTSFSGASAISLGRAPDDTTMDDLRVCFGVDVPHPFYMSRLGFSPEKICWLDFSEESGLSILWCFSNSNELLFSDERPVYKSLVSPHVKSLKYIYYYSDTSQWKTETSIREGQDASKQLPLFIEVVFVRGSETFTRLIPIFSSADPNLYTPESASNSSSSSGGSQTRSERQNGRSAKIESLPGSILQSVSNRKFNERAAS